MTEHISVTPTIESNPYSAQLLIEDSVTGYVRIAPPFCGSESLYEKLSELEGVAFTPLVSSDEAVVLDYYRDTTREDELDESPNDHLVTATRRLLDHVGLLALPTFNETTHDTGIL